MHCAIPPKCLSDVVESYIGAVFVDSGYDYSQVESFFNKHILPYFTDMGVYDVFANKHPVSMLSNVFNNLFHCSEWRILIKRLGPVTVADGITSP